MTLKCIALYEPDELDVTPLWSAVFLAVGNYYVEVRVQPNASAVFQGDTLCNVKNRLSLATGERLLFSEYETEEAAKAYFWSFVRDPEMGFMEASI